MPIFEYECAKCGHRLEQILRAGQREPEQCPNCGGPLQKLFPTSIGIVFRGSGFYITDSRNKRTEKKSESKD